MEHNINFAEDILYLLNKQQQDDFIRSINNERGTLPSAVLFYDAQINLLREMRCDGFDASILSFDSTLNMTKGLYVITCVFKACSNPVTQKDGRGAFHVGTSVFAWQLVSIQLFCSAFGRSCPTLTWVTPFSDTMMTQRSAKSLGWHFRIHTCWLAHDIWRKMWNAIFAMQLRHARAWTNDDETSYLQYSVQTGYQELPMWLNSILKWVQFLFVHCLLTAVNLTFLTSACFICSFSY